MLLTQILEMENYFIESAGKPQIVRVHCLLQHSLHFLRHISRMSAALQLPCIARSDLLLSSSTTANVSYTEHIEYNRLYFGCIHGVRCTLWESLCCYDIAS